MKIIIQGELRKVVRNHLWQLSMILCLLLSVFCLSAEKSNSDHPLIEYSEESIVLLSPVQDETAAERQEYFNRLYNRYSQASDLITEMNLARAGLFFGSDESVMHTLTPDELKECRELLKQGESVFRRNFEAVQWLNGYYFSIVDYPGVVEGVLTDLHQVNPYSKPLSARRMQLTENLYSSLDSQSFADINIPFWDMYSTSRFSLFWLAALIITVFLFLDADHKAGMEEQIHVSTVSQKSRTCSRIITLLILSTGLTLLYILVQLITCMGLYGDPGWNSCIQSIPNYYYCPFAWSIPQWFTFRSILWILQSWALCSILTILHNRMHYIGYGLFILLITLSIFATLKIGDYSTLDWLKQINLYTLFLPELWFANLRFIGDLTREEIVLILLILLVLLGSLGQLFVPEKLKIRKRTIRNRKLLVWYGKVPGHQLRGILLHNPLILCALAAAGILTWTCTSVIVSESGSRNTFAPLAELYNQYGGVLTREKLAVFREKKASFDQQEKELDQAVEAYEEGQIQRDDYLRALDAWSQSNEERNLWSSLFQDLDNGKTYLGFTRGFEALLGINTSHRDQTNALFCAAILLFSFSALFSSEHSLKTDDLFRTARCNGSRIRSKLLLAAVGAAIIFVLVYGLDLLRIWKLYPMEDWNIPMSSITAGIPTAETISPELLNLSVKEVFIRVCMTRFFGVLSCLFLVLICSMITEKPLETLLLAGCSLAVTWLLVKAGIQPVELISPWKMLEGNQMILSQNRPFVFWIFTLLFCGVFIRYRKKQCLSFRKSRI